MSSLYSSRWYAISNGLSGFIHQVTLFRKKCWQRNPKGTSLHSPEELSTTAQNKDLPQRRFQAELKNSKDCTEKPCKRFRFWYIYQLTECSRGLWKARGGSSCFARNLGRDYSGLVHWHRNWVLGRRGSVKRTQRWRLGKGRGRAITIDNIYPDKGPADICIYTQIYTHIRIYKYVCTHSKETVTKSHSQYSCCTRLILLYWFLG